MKLFKSLYFVIYLTSLLWIVGGLLIMFSTVIDFSSWVKNVAIGLFFLSIGLFFCLKEKNLFDFLQHYPTSEKRLWRKVVIGQGVFIVMALLIGLIALTGIVSRLFEEGMAIFD